MKTPNIQFLPQNLSLTGPWPLALGCGVRCQKYIQNYVRTFVFSGQYCNYTVKQGVSCNFSAGPQLCGNLHWKSVLGLSCQSEITEPDTNYLPPQSCLEVLSALERLFFTSRGFLPSEKLSFLGKVLSTPSVGPFGPIQRLCVPWSNLRKILRTIYFHWYRYMFLEIMMILKNVISLNFLTDADLEWHTFWVLNNL